MYAPTIKNRCIEGIYIIISYIYIIIIINFFFNENKSWVLEVVVASSDYLLYMTSFYSHINY